LPQSLKKIDLGQECNCPLPKNLPQSLETIWFGKKYDKPLPDNLPKSLKEIQINMSNLDKIFGNTYEYKENSIFKNNVHLGIIIDDLFKF